MAEKIGPGHGNHLLYIMDSRSNGYDNSRLKQPIVVVAVNQVILREAKHFIRRSLWMAL